MKALSIQQPWAFAILYLGKRVENRTWYTDFRGPIYIHAGKKFDRDALEDLADDIRKLPEPRPQAICGGLVGTATVVDCVRPDNVPLGQELWANGPWCFILDDVKPLDRAIPLKGRLGFFEVEAEQAATP
jgi:hypothetical protein